MLIPTPQNTRTVTDMRENTIKLLRDVNKLGIVYIFHRSDPVAVMLSIKEFEKLQKIVEKSQIS